MKILIIGTHALDTESLDKLVKNTAYRVERVSTGKKGLRLCEKQDFDLVFIDVFLPDGKGYDLISEIKRECPKSNIIATTDSNSRELEQNVRKEGVIYYMIKPIDTKHLESIIEHIHAM